MGWIGKINKALQLPPDALQPMPRIVISGDREVLIGGRVVLAEYTPQCYRHGRRDTLFTSAG